MCDSASGSFAEDFYRDGAVCIRGALDQTDLAMARYLFSWSRENKGQAAQSLDFGADGSIYIETHNSAARATYLEALAKSGIPALVASVIEVDELWYLGEQIYIKEGKPGACNTAWHQDSDLPLDATGAVCLWISFESLQREEGLKFVCKSHRGPRYNQVVDTGPDGEPVLLYPDAADKTPFPDVDATPEKFDLISWSTEPGDVVLFHSLTIHGAAPAPSSGRRNTLCLRFFGPDTRYTKLPERRPTGTAAAEMTEFLWEGLQEGDVLRRGTQFRKVFG